MDLNYFKDILFDLINESDALESDLLDIQCDDKNDTMKVIMKDGTHVMIRVNQGIGVIRSVFASPRISIKVREPA